MDKKDALKNKETMVNNDTLENGIKDKWIINYLEEVNYFLTIHLIMKLTTKKM